MFDSFTISLVLWRAVFCPLLSFRTRCENGVIARRTGEAGCKHLRLEFSPKVKKERKKTPCVEQSKWDRFPWNSSSVIFWGKLSFVSCLWMWRTNVTNAPVHWLVSLIYPPPSSSDWEGCGAVCDNTQNVKQYQYRYFFGTKFFPILVLRLFPVANFTDTGYETFFRYQIFLIPPE